MDRRGGSEGATDGPLMTREPGVVGKCDVPPKGWRCRRDVGHDGPCAAVPELRDGCTRLRIAGRPEDPETIRIEAVRGEFAIPLDVDSIAFELDCHGGRVTMSWPASAVELDIDVRPLSPDERVDQMRKLLEDSVVALKTTEDIRQESTAETIEMWLKLHDLGRR